MMADDMSEFAARDREGEILGFLETLLRNVEEDLGTLADGTDFARGAVLAHNDAVTGLAMAVEYLAELNRLADRPVAGIVRAA
jgi:hypothetical protein